jgi:MATE family multidrug resistance protein
MLGQLGIVLMGVFDVGMLGSYSKFHQGAVALANGVFFLFFLFGMGVLFSVSPLIAIAVGKKQPEEGYTIFKSGMWVTGFLSVVLIAILYLIGDNFSYLKQDPEVEKLAVAYLKIAAWSIIPMFIFITGRQYTDGHALTWVAMAATFIALPLNVLLNYILIYGNWGMPEMGAEGAGIATLISRCFMAVLILAYIFFSRKMKQYNVKGKPSMTYVNTIFKIGIPIGFQFFFEVGIFTVANIFAGNLGATPLAAHNVALSLASITFMVASGLSAGSSIMIGNAYGENNWPKMKRVGKVFLFTISSFMLFCALLFVLFNYFFSGLLSTDAEVVQLAALLLLYAAFFQLSDGIQVVSLGMLRGMKDVLVPSVVTFIAYWVIGIPVCYYGAFNLGLGAEGIWIGLSVGLTVSAVVLTVRFFALIKKGINI